MKTIFKQILHFLKILLFVCYSYTKIHLKVSVIFFTNARLPSSLKELADIHPPNEVLTAVYDTHCYHFFSATTSEPTHVILVIAESPFLQQMTKNLRGGPRGNRRRHFMLLKSSAEAMVLFARMTSKFGKSPIGNRMADRITNGLLKKALV